MPKRRAPSLAPAGDAAVRLSKYLWLNLPRESSIVRKQVGRRWLTHQVVRTGDVAGPFHYEHIVPVLVFALRHEIHGESFSDGDIYGCIVTEPEHRALVKLRTAPNVFIPALACERDQLLDVCLRRYSDVDLHLVPLPQRQRVWATSAEHLVASTSERRAGARRPGVIPVSSAQ